MKIEDLEAIVCTDCRLFHLCVPGHCAAFDALIKLIEPISRLVKTLKEM